MKQMPMVIINLNRDVFIYIMSFVAKSGIKNLANAVLVCKKFKEIAEDESVLHAADFNGVRLKDRYELFQEFNSLVTKSAIAGNSTAKYMLAKVILISSWMVGSSRASLFVGQFARNRSPNPKVSGRNLDHPELVRLFLRGCSPRDLAKMYMPVLHYITSCIRYCDESTAFFSSFEEFHKIAMSLKRCEKSKDTWRHGRDCMMQYMPLRRSIEMRNVGQIITPTTVFHVRDQILNTRMDELVAEFETKRASVIAIYTSILVELI